MTEEEKLEQIREKALQLGVKTVNQGADSRYPKRNGKEVTPVESAS